MKYQAVIFDLFGTLVEIFSSREYERLLSEMSDVLSVSSQDFTRLWNETRRMRVTGALASVEANIKDICRTLDLQPEGDRITAAAQIRLEFTRRSLKPRHDAVETLTQLKKTGYKTGLISDCSADVPFLWQETPFAPLIDVPIFSCAVGLKKPDPRIYQLVCEQLEVMPQNCLYIGDGDSHELTGASQVGMYPVLIRVSHEDVHDAFRLDSEEWQGHKISTLKDVLTLVDRTSFCLER